MGNSDHNLIKLDLPYGESTMKNLTLKKWAAIAEIIAAVAVIISLVFVVQSINQNTAAVQSTNDNFMYELQYARTREIVSSPGMAEIYLKIRSGEELTDVEQERFYWDKIQELSLWELGFNRNRDGLYDTDLWESWNRYYETEFTSQFPQEWWEESRSFYMQDFQDHVDAAYAVKANGNH